MSGPYVTLMRLQSVVFREWLKTLLATVDYCAIILDPRPDLAVPARRMRCGYPWWW